ncbi:hypothetical protein L1987_06955 [Smallanthus sonchifolius]|uniref:Uncharacterized protein n=1 Tax=Smallanthus sonchifolius TaxID=185202 RepID=A0ACB9JZI3_9ASTR|nr:hypothetical protein L1987_06955 [Smallanthus sonchifolius]
MATESTPNFVKMKPGGGIRDAKTKFDSSVIKNRVVGNQSIDSKHKFSSTSTNVSKIEAKGKSIWTSSQTKTKTKTSTVKDKTKEKKVYSLPGQKFDVPEEREPLRIFYESLSKQLPSSEMAEFWMMEHGMLSPERAKKAFEKKKRKQKEIRVRTPIKSPPPPPSRPESSKRPQQLLSQSRGESSKKPQPVIVAKNGDAKPNKRVVNDSDDDEDNFTLSHKRRKG